MFSLRLTNKAKQQIDKVCEKNNIFSLELDIKKTGCAGLEYTWQEGKRESIEPTDELIKIGKGKLTVKSKAKPYLHGSEIDFVESPFSQSFEVKNPNAVSECGCGISLAFDKKTIDRNIEILEL